MTVIAILVAVVLAFLAFRFITGMIKFAVLGVIVLICLFVAYQAGAFLMVLVYSQLTTPVGLLVGGAVMGLFVNGMLGGYGALMSELYPTEARATAQNVLFNLGRGVGGFGPVAIGAVASAWSFQAAIALLAVIYLLDIAATLLLIPERRGAPLD